MRNKFETGDRVRHTEYGEEGTVTRLDPPCRCYVRYDDGDSEEYNVWESSLEFINPKEVFLTRLQELLGTFDAVIGVCLDHTYSEEAMVLMNDKIVAAGRTITAENVFDYDKD